MYDFLLVININLPPVLHRFGNTAFQVSKIVHYLATPITFNPPPSEGFPWGDLRTIFRGCQRMAKVPNDEEKLPKISTSWVRCTNVTDRRQTNRRQTDGRAIAYSEREREFTFAKKHVKTVFEPVDVCPTLNLSAKLSYIICGKSLHVTVHVCLHFRDCWMNPNPTTSLGHPHPYL